MKRLLSVLLVASLLVGGCGVYMNAEYSQRLDETVAWAAEVNTRAEANALTQAEMAQALKTNAALWRLFKQARDGVTPGEDE